VARCPQRLHERKRTLKVGKDRTAEVIIIGAGGIGYSIAYYLAGLRDDSLDTNAM
jgi:shikimate 5-dehydrogenase